MWKTLSGTVAAFGLSAGPVLAVGGGAPQLLINQSHLQTPDAFFQAAGGLPVLDDSEDADFHTTGGMGLMRTVLSIATVWAVAITAVIALGS